ncbi:response regulator [uncultured Marinococcus sp.]|uniref:response regulator transcription factor n=1 Tax=uncultured Marinococcus sp. TaxID=487012 RepID=UPI00260441BF|nr:response regulator [uncultured Marinococcus sp.]
MTTKILIVDDEPMICEGLSQTIDWESIGVKVEGVAYDGMEALDILNEQTIDIVLTDITMPNMDGLALTEELTALHPGVEVIMFSGYDEFEYARQALRLGVNDFLLKPINIEELLTIVKRLQHKKHYAGNDHNDPGEKLKIAVQKQLFRHHVTAEEMIQWEEQYKSCYVVVAEIKGYAQGKEKMEKEGQKEQLMQMIEENLARWTKQFARVWRHENEWIYICCGDDSDSSIKKERITKLQKQIEEKGINVHAAVSASGPFQDIRVLYKQADTFITSIRGTSKSAISGPDEKIQEPSLPAAKAFQDQLAVFIMEGRTGEAKELVQEVFDELIEKDTGVEPAFRMMRELEVIIKNKVFSHIRERTFDINEFKLQQDVDTRIYNTAEDIQSFFMEDMLRMAGALSNRKETNWIIDQVLSYMKHNYQHDLQAKTIAEDHFITPNYFSILFKQETGLSFSDYLNTLRIEKASELLVTTSNRVFEIAEYVGYSEYKYFVKVFKKYKGTTPTQYRAMHTTNIQ